PRRGLPQPDRAARGGERVMAALGLQVPRPAGWQRLRWALADGVTVMRRNLAHGRYQPGELIGALVFPAIMVVLFGYIFGSAIAVPGGGNYREFLIPGLFATTAVNILPSMAAMARDSSRGVVDRFRSLPIARMAVPFGQAAATTVYGLGSFVLMGLCGLAVG